MTKQNSSANKKYRAYFKHLNPKDKEKFKDSKCLLPISVGQLYHEGKKFEATVKLINKHFKECLILVSDTLQRHTMAIFNQDSMEDELHIQSKGLGDAWINRNISALNSLSIPYEISRWDSWIADSDFKEASYVINDVYKNNANYAEAVYGTCNSFLKRYKKANEYIEMQSAFDKSIEYILEECAVAYMWSKFENSYVLYPKGLNQALNSIRQSSDSQRGDIPMGVSFQIS